MAIARWIYHVFDRIEDHIRGKLSHYPIVYAVVASVGVVLLWRGIWVTADFVFEAIIAAHAGMPGSTITTSGLVWWDGPLCALIGLIVMLITGVFVSNFIGNEIIITGLRGDKKISEKTEQEMRLEVGAIGDIRREVRHIMELIEDFDARRNGKK